MACKPNTILDSAQQRCDPTGSGDFNITNTNTSLIDGYVEEHINIGGATLNVFKLLGVHEQGTLVDVAGQGRPFSSGSAAQYVHENVFNDLCGTWRSSQTGTNIQQTFIGYDFGPIYNHEDDRNIYGVETYNNKHITTIRIQQSSQSNYRAGSIRLERSMDGVKWYGVGIRDLPDNDEFNYVYFDGSSPSRYWRLRPVVFNGTSTDRWEVNNLQLFEYEQTSLKNIQDEMGFLESRDRDYASELISIKGTYDLLDTQTEVTMFAFTPTTQNMYITVSFSQCVRRLGRPLVVGDIIEIPSEIQYTSDLQPVKKYMEVTDVAWSTDGYTPGWQPTLQRIIVEPMLSSQETLDIIQGNINVPDYTGFINIDDSNYTDLTDVTDRIVAQSQTNVPQRGINEYDVAEIPKADIEAAAAQGFDIAHLSSNQRKLYIEDGMPPNGMKYTEGATYPDKPKDGDYHRLTYPDTDVPTRLLRYSTIKNRWVYCETDRRSQYNAIKPELRKYLTSTTAVPAHSVTTTPTPPVEDEC